MVKKFRFNRDPFLLMSFFMFTHLRMNCSFPRCRSIVGYTKEPFYYTRKGFFSNGIQRLFQFAAFAQIPGRVFAGFYSEQGLSISGLSVVKLMVQSKKGFKGE